MADVKWLDASFTDERGRPWEIKLTVPVVHQFTAKHQLPLGAFHPGALRQDQYAEVAYLGTRYASRAKADEETLEQFLEALDGPSYMKMTEAAYRAVINFILKTSTPKDKLVEALDTVRELDEKMVGVLSGLGTAFGSSLASPASPPQNPSASESLQP